MPNLTNDTWLDFILDIVNNAHHWPPTHECWYYLAYNLLLTYCFQFDTLPICLLVYLQAPPYPHSLNRIDFIVTSCNPNGGPLLFVKVKDDHWAESPTLQLQADQQMRQQLKDLWCKCQVPTLWGLSLLGTFLWIYCCNIANGLMMLACICQLAYAGQTHFGVLASFLTEAWDLPITS